ncbi:DUF6278 family protein [Leekyejoonella antrihumi]|uniref:Uncharacterized protein n=1 Tax=Leekyejoonella antrihumi TaxID=1660198 RepID=A0A563DVH5_9MICO|nr:hypothetical protein FGL98_19330 [Leekyejoonella antrihumi]
MPGNVSQIRWVGHRLSRHQCTHRDRAGRRDRTYLGSVIVAAAPGATWTVWPNGHPVVSLASGRDIEVVAVASQRVASGAPSLRGVPRFWPSGFPTPAPSTGPQPASRIRSQPPWRHIQE